MFLSIQAKAQLMDHVQMMSTNAVTGSVSCCNTPVMIMTTVETSQMSLAVVSNQEPPSNDDDLQKENWGLNNGTISKEFCC